MIVYKFRPDMVYEGPVELPDGPTIPKYHTFSAPPEIPEGYYAVMQGGWILVEGTAPVYPPLPTADQIKAEIVIATQARLDNFAKTRSYDGILSACTYAVSSVVKFQTEGEYCVSARDTTWAKLYEILAEVEAGTRPMPSGYAEIEPELPVLEWPDTVIEPEVVADPVVTEPVV